MLWSWPKLKQSRLVELIINQPEHCMLLNNILIEEKTPQIPGEKKVFSYFPFMPMCQGNVVRSELNILVIENIHLCLVNSRDNVYNVCTSLL